MSLIINRFIEQAEGHFKAGTFLLDEMYFQEAAFLFHLSSEKYVKAVAIQGGNKPKAVKGHEISEICKKIPDLPENLIDGITEPAKAFEENFSINIRYDISNISINETAERTKLATEEIAINAMRAIEFLQSQP